MFTEDISPAGSIQERKIVREYAADISSLEGWCKAAKGVVASFSNIRQARTDDILRVGLRMLLSFRWRSIGAHTLDI